MYYQRYQQPYQQPCIYYSPPLGQVPPVLGPPKVPVDIQQIVDAAPNCFSSRTIIPAINRALAFASEITVIGVAPSPGAVRERRDLTDLAHLLIDTRDRLATEPVQRYCRDGDNANQYAEILRLIVMPFAAAFSIGSLQAIKNYQQAVRADLRLAVDLPIVGRIQAPTWAKAAALVGGGLLLLRVLR